MGCTPRTKEGASWPRGQAGADGYRGEQMGPERSCVKGVGTNITQWGVGTCFGGSSYSRAEVAGESPRQRQKKRGHACNIA